MEIVSWLWAEFEKSSPLANFLQIGSASLAAGALIYRVIRKRQVRETEIRRNLEESVHLKSEKIQDLEKQLAREQAFNPHNWLNEFEAVIKKGNYETAIMALFEDLSDSDEVLSRAHFELSKFFAATSPDGGFLSLSHALRHARVAHYLRPQDKSRTRLLRNVEAALLREGKLKNADLMDAPSSSLPNDLIDFFGENESSPEQLLDFLLRVAHQHFTEDRVDIAERILQRALSIARRRLGVASRDTLSIAIRYAATLVQLDRYQEALFAYDEALPFLDAVFGPLHAETVEAKVQRVMVIYFLDKPEQLAEAERLAVVLVEHFGNGDGFSLRARFAVAQSRVHLTEYREGLEELDALIPDLEKGLGALTQETLHARLFRATVLQAKGRHSEAIAGFEQVLPTLQKALGTRHRATIQAQIHLADCLLAGDKAGSAAKILDHLIPDLVAVYGADSDKTLLLREKRATIISRLGRWAEAVSEIRECVRIRSEGKGESHPDTLRAAEIRDQILGTAWAPKIAPDHNSGSASGQA